MTIQIIEFSIKYVALYQNTINYYTIGHKMVKKYLSKNDHFFR